MCMFRKQQTAHQHEYQFEFEYELLPSKTTSPHQQF